MHNNNKIIITVYIWVNNWNDWRNRKKMGGWDKDSDRQTSGWDSRMVKKQVVIRSNGWIQIVKKQVVKGKINNLYLFTQKLTNTETLLIYLLLTSKSKLCFRMYSLKLIYSRSLTIHPLRSVSLLNFGQLSNNTHAV